MDMDDGFADTSGKTSTFRQELLADVVSSNEDLNWKHERDDIYERANDVESMMDLVAFYDNLTSRQQDYNTICYSVAAMALAAARVMDCSPAGGITGFQAGAVAWEFWQHWLHKQGPMRMMYFSNMLYPQYENEFGKTISQETWTWLQEEAEKNLKKYEGDEEFASSNVLAHWKSIVDGVVPFGFTVTKDD